MYRKELSRGLDFANAKSGMVKNFVISYSSVITRSLLILLSLRGAKRRSNPERERGYTGLLRYARNDVEKMDCHDFLARRLPILLSLPSVTRQSLYTIYQENKLCYNKKNV